MEEIGSYCSHDRIVPTSHFAESWTFLAEKTLPHFMRVGDPVLQLLIGQDGR